MSSFPSLPSFRFTPSRLHTAPGCEHRTRAKRSKNRHRASIQTPAPTEDPKLITSYNNIISSHAPGVPVFPQTQHVGPTPIASCMRLPARLHQTEPIDGLRPSPFLLRGLHPLPPHTLSTHSLVTSQPVQMCTRSHMSPNSSLPSPPTPPTLPLTPVKYSVTSMRGLESVTEPRNWTTFGCRSFGRSATSSRNSFLNPKPLPQVL